MACEYICVDRPRAAVNNYAGIIFLHNSKICRSIIILGFCKELENNWVVMSQKDIL